MKRLFGLILFVVPLLLRAQAPNGSAQENIRKKDICAIDSLVVKALTALKNNMMNDYLALLPTREEMLAYFDSAQMVGDEKKNLEMREFKKKNVDTILAQRKREGVEAFKDGRNSIGKDPEGLKTLVVTWDEPYINDGFGVSNGRVDYYVKAGKSYYHSVFVLARFGTKWKVTEFLRFSGDLRDDTPLDKFTTGGYHKKLD